MRVTTDIVEQRRFLKPPIYVVKCSVEFSEVERAVIRERGLATGIIYDQVHDPYRDLPYPRTLAEVMKRGIETAFRNPAEAAVFRAQLEQKTLPYLKQVIDISETAPRSGPRTVEL